MMKMYFNFKNLVFALFFLLISTPVFAQQQFEKAVDYLDFMSAQRREISKNFMSYSSAVAHGKSARKVENRRKELVKAAAEAKKQIAAMPPFKGDNALRDSTVSYLEMVYHVLNDDYGKVVDLEEVAEQSYDGMEAYFKAQDLADERLDKANEFVSKQLSSFAKRNNINLVESQDQLGKKLEATNKINQYQRELFLITFKCSNQEKYMIEALNKKDLNAVEQNKNMLAQYTEENLKKLATLKSFNNDASLLNATRQKLLFYQTECKTQMPIMIDFLVKEDNFNKIKKAFDLKSQSERTQADIDSYNKAVKEMNTAVNKSNSTNKMLNEKRSNLGDSWNDISRKFLDTHTPKY